MKELIETRRIAMELLGLNLPDEAIEKIRKIRGLCNVGILEETKNGVTNEEAEAIVNEVMDRFKTRGAYLTEIGYYSRR